MADYENVQKGSLKFKGVSDSGIKKKKKKKKDKDKEKAAKRVYQEEFRSGGETSTDVREPVTDMRTPAELAFAKAKEKRSAEVILKKASKPHKERIMEFNRHLDTLTEHFDIPKVSWTK